MPLFTTLTIIHPFTYCFHFLYCPVTYILRQYNTDTSLILSYYLGTAYYLITWYLLYHVITWHLKLLHNVQTKSVTINSQSNIY